MGRHKQPEIRDRILDACVDHALVHGLPDRLEPLAAASGTSARMLIYHFGTRDALLRETLRRARRRQRDFFGELVAPRPEEPYPSTLRRAWRVMTGPAGRPYLSMFGKLREDAEQQLWPGFRRESTTDWLRPFEDGMRSIGRPELATLVLAVVRGLIMDIETTGDVSRADQAFEDFLAALVLADETPATAGTCHRA
ncbi:TetR/AcrR family transcriptional regulator [Streptomyces sp. CB09001]|uniref:TetR/AcrR family transcriptional regulator n=2 Tax=unclassified Streptomyces TaxID=2593676 RepID=UPI000E20EEEE|nr:TetR/AcrR family transcriptional regulator [Streptomyces sp. CB09001]AXL91842.1 TetR/AcrR family transcriptional regulator [Streptomyces sp. CB09001]